MAFLLLIVLQIVPRSEYLQLVNEIRAAGCECGNQYFPAAPPVVWNSTLEETARLHSEDMYKRNYFSHISKRGKTPGDRLKAQGYRFFSYAENIFFASGYTPTPTEVVLAWKNSPSHCKNVMNPALREMGVGIYQGYYTQLFGTRQTK
jgi:uncharacterized protein YkwD